MLPDLLIHCRLACDPQTGNTPAPDLNVRVHRLTAQVLAKLGEAELAWLPADRASPSNPPPRRAR